MIRTECRTKDNTPSAGKRRIFFTCHPDDFSTYFDKICDDIFRTHDNCAVFYTVDMTEEISPDEEETVYKSNNLFVVPVTYKLLSSDSRAIVKDIAYAKENHIPVLPVVVERGLDELYSKPENFGELQYLNTFSEDKTEISYEEKLEKYLNSVLLSSEMAQRIRDAFDAYIFLSYRKMDRAYANTLMRLIHKNETFQNVAIWYDEFLTPGESFRQNIMNNLNNSKLFALLVTPNLLEEPGGKPNFIMREEYPAALESGIEILSAEMQPTNKERLQSKFEGIPHPVNVYQPEFIEHLSEIFTSLAIEPHNGDSSHNFLIGLAYMDGIDMERDPEKGLSLILRSAEEGLPEAMQRLYIMYYTGMGVPIDYSKAEYWLEKYVESNLNEYGEKDEKYIDSLGNLSALKIKLNKIPDALIMGKKVYELRKELLGATHKDALGVINNNASALRIAGEYEEALKMFGTAYEAYIEEAGKETEESIIVLNNISLVYSAMGKYEDAFGLAEKVYNFRLEFLGETNEYTMLALHNLATAYYDLSDYQNAVIYGEKVYKQRCKNLGKKHPDTMLTANNLSGIYSDSGNFTKSLEYAKIAYNYHRDMYGENHPYTVVSAINLAGAYRDKKNFKRAQEYMRKSCDNMISIYGEEHISSIKAIDGLAVILIDSQEFEEALERSEKAYNLALRELGKKHYVTLSAMANNAIAHFCNGKQDTALNLLEVAYNLSMREYGEDSSVTMNVINNLTTVHTKLMNFDKALEYADKFYDLCLKKWGEDNITTINALETLVDACVSNGEALRGGILYQTLREKKKNVCE